MIISNVTYFRKSTNVR